MIISIDIGGTKILTVLLNAQLQIIDREKQGTPLTTDGNIIVALLIASIDSILRRQELRRSDLAGLAIAVPSAISIEDGLVLSATNIGFSNFPLRARLEERLKLPVLLENDVNAGLYGEFRRGAAVGKKHVIGVYPGTGIGGAVIVNGQLYRGRNGAAGEIGHLCVQEGGQLCACGSRGCLETLSSKTAIAKDLVQLAAVGKSPSIFQAVATDFTRVKSRHILAALEAGEEDVLAVLERASYFLGLGLASCVNVFNPELIVLGGGLVEKLGTRFVEPAIRSMREQAMPDLVRGVEVKIAHLADESAVIGGAVLFYESELAPPTRGG